MKIFGLSLTKNGPIQNNFWNDSIVWNTEGETSGGCVYNRATGEWVDWTGFPTFDYELNEEIYPWGSHTNYHMAYPVEIPAGVGSWFTNVTKEQVDNAGIDPIASMLYNNAEEIKYGFVPNYKYGYDYRWNINPGTLQNEGMPPVIRLEQGLYFRIECAVQTRMIVLYNDTPNVVEGNLRISDQSIKGAIAELYTWEYDFHSANHPALNYRYSELINWAGADYDPSPNEYDPPDSSPTFWSQIKTDGPSYTPEHTKFMMIEEYGLQPASVGIPDTVPYKLGPAGTKGAWAIYFLTLYVTKEDGDYAGIDGDYMVLSTETN